jgi:hypothetical protein
MRDVFWTIIVIWLIYQLVNIFKGAGQKKKYVYNNSQAGTDKSSTQPSIKKDVKSAIKKHADKEGEYIDYEEIK